MTPLTQRCAEVAARLDAVGPARTALAQLPTPLHEAPRLSAEIGVRVLLKRDDLTGLGLGGNKVRALEYLIADAVGQGCDCLVTGSGPQSNWTMLAALTARRCGLEPHVVCYGDPVPARGNLLLHQWLSTTVSFTGDPDRASVDAGIDAVAAGLRAAGHRPYVVPRGGATALGALGYLRASIELALQLTGVDEAPAELWLATGSGGTHAGLAAGAALLGPPYAVVGVTVSRSGPECVRRVQALATGAAELAGGGPVRPDADVREGWIGPGYGVASPEGDAATQLVALTEGVFLDPVFGAKAMAALLAECRAGRVTGPVVFLVSGGAPTLFAAG